MKKFILFLILLNNSIVFGQYYFLNWNIYPSALDKLNGKVREIYESERSRTLDSSRWKTVFKFNDFMKLSEMRSLCENEIRAVIKYKYDSIGNCVMNYSTKDTSDTNHYEIFIDKYEYDKSSRIKSVISFSSRSDTSSISNQLQYDSLNNLIEYHMKILSPGGKNFRTEKIKYDGLNRIIQISDIDSTTPDSQITRRVTKFEYDLNGNLSKYERVENDIIELNEQYSYDFDENNNWIKSYKLGFNNRKYLRSERKIQYR
jgi:hypothetical protein